MENYIVPTRSRYRQPQIYNLQLVLLLLQTLVSSAWLTTFSSQDTYDELRAQQVINYTEAAYCTDDLDSWNCTVCQQFPGMRNVTTLEGHARNVRGFIGIDLGRTSSGADSIPIAAEFLPNSDVFGRPDALGVASDRRRRRRLSAVDAENVPDDNDRLPSPRVVVTFSGTDPKSIRNWIDDLEAVPISQSYTTGDCENCWVHRGFLASYAVVQEQVRSTVVEHLRHNPTAEVLITGHSLGGALATLCFLDLYEFLDTLRGSGSQVSFAPLHIFGAPRVGNSAFAEFMSSRGVPIYRLVHHRDPVPHLPFTSWGYTHPSTEVFYSYNQTTYVVCDETGEDPSCSNQFWVLPNFAYISDHLHYLEVEYPKAYLNCLLANEENRGEVAEGEKAVRRAAAAEAIEKEWEELAHGLIQKVVRASKDYEQSASS